MSISSLAHLFRSVLVIPSAFFPILGAGASGAATGAVVSWFLITLGLFPIAISFLTMATDVFTAVAVVAATGSQFPVQLSCYERIGLERSSHGYKRQFKKISRQRLG